MLRIEHHLADPDMTDALGRTLGRALRSGDVLELRGELGAGKTTLVRGIAAGMGLDPRHVSSPTFVILHRYSPEAGAQTTSLVHMDAYRLDPESTLDELGWDRAVIDAVICVEWPERVGSSLRDDLRARLGTSWRDHVGTVTLEHSERADGSDARDVTIEVPEAWGDRHAIRALTTNPPRRCPRLETPVAPDAPHYPFASERAQLADLYGWFSESYTVSRPMDAEDFEGPDGPEHL